MRHKIVCLDFCSPGIDLLPWTYSPLSQFDPKQRRKGFWRFGTDKNKPIMTIQINHSEIINEVTQPVAIARCKASDVKAANLFISRTPSMDHHSIIKSRATLVCY